MCNKRIKSLWRNQKTVIKRAVRVMVGLVGVVGVVAGGVVGVDRVRGVVPRGKKIKSEQALCVYT